MPSFALIQLDPDNPSGPYPVFVYQAADEKAAVVAHGQTGRMFVVVGLVVDAVLSASDEAAAAAAAPAADPAPSPIADPAALPAADPTTTDVLAAQETGIPPATFAGAISATVQDPNAPVDPGVPTDRPTEPAS